MGKKKTLDEYLEVLERFDIPITDRVNRRRFQEKLEEILGKFTPKDTEPFWEASQWGLEELLPRGVRQIEVKYPWGRQLRYTIKGYRGLFGIRKVMEMLGVRF